MCKKKNGHKDDISNDSINKKETLYKEMYEQVFFFANETIISSNVIISNGHHYSDARLNTSFMHRALACTAAFFDITKGNKIHYRSTQITLYFTCDNNKISLQPVFSLRRPRR